MLCRFTACITLRYTGPRCCLFWLQGGDRLLILTPGGGGFGAPGSGGDSDVEMSEEEAEEEEAGKSKGRSSGRQNDSAEAPKQSDSRKRKKLPSQAARPQRPLRDGGSLQRYRSTQESA